MAPIITRESSATDLNSQSAETIALGEYLFLRICQANPKMKTIFGIPGDFNLNLLEYLYTDSVKSKLRYVGHCNELNAGYTTDGYAQAIGGIAAIITTYGVGELSALNAIAGSFAEFSPVLHIVGTSSTNQVEYAKNPANSVRNIHHLVQNKNPLLAPDHDVYKSIVEPFSCVQESLTYEGTENGENLNKIDKVLSTILQESRPGYLFIPRDVSDLMVPRARLSLPLCANASIQDSSELEKLTLKILCKLYKSKRPAIIGDALVRRFNFVQQFEELTSKLPPNFVRLFSTNMSRYINEQLPNFVGTYNGKLSSEKKIQEDLENETDLLINFGYFNAETNTASYTWDFSKVDDYVEIHPDYVLIDKEYFSIKNYATGQRLFSLGDLIETLADSLDITKFENNLKNVNNITYQFQPKKWFENSKVPSNTIPQTKLIDFLNSYLKPNDFLIVETCSFLFAIADLKFPPGVHFISQSFFGSIGYALPATLGVSAAAKDLGTDRRVVLIQGDGSAQMTIQELSGYIRYDIVCPKIFLLNNEGYTVERKILGPTRSYNDIQSTWNWGNFFEIFGDINREKHTSVKLENAEEFDEYFKTVKGSEKIEFIELMMGKMDCPDRFDYICGAKQLPSS